MEPGQRPGGADGGVGGLAEQAPGMGLAGAADVAAHSPAGHRTGAPAGRARDTTRAWPAGRTGRRPRRRRGSRPPSRARSRGSSAAVATRGRRRRGWRSPAPRPRPASHSTRRADRRVEREPLVGRQLQRRQPGAAADPEHVAHRWPQETAGRLPKPGCGRPSGRGQAGPVGHEPAQTAGRLVGLPRPPADSRRPGAPPGSRRRCRRSCAWPTAMALVRSGLDTTTLPAW